ncbi:MAG: biotin/lipoyl-binding protein [Ardenticatenaceae bacterium]|nr:biotin/lipoyl-binding protein [Ardenticatenaceae bacterium]
MKYFATVHDEEYVIEIDHDDRIMVNGEPYEIDFHQMMEAGVASLLLNNRSLEAFVEEREDMWEVLIQGEVYAVKVQDERSHRLSQARGTAVAVTGEATVNSPMPGIIIAVSVKEGDAVQKGQKVVILESMKMENELSAPRDGMVLRVSVQPGASVEKGQVLVVIGDE